MPHILLESSNDSFCLDEKFPFIAKGKYDQKIAVQEDKKEFLLTKVLKDGNELIKTDIPTRLSPVSLMKSAIAGYANKTEQNILFSNLQTKKNKVAPEEKYLKNIEFFANEFETTKDIFVEVGFGSGKHLLYQAMQNPEKIIIGLEIHYPSIEQVLKQAKLQNIENILVINYDARLFLEFLSSNSVERIFVHFPVPWDKKPHRRVMSEAFINEALRVLKITGTLELRTDSINYFQYSKELLENFTEYPTKILKDQDLEVTSKYEARWKRQEKNIWDVIIESIKESPATHLDGEFTFPKKYEKGELLQKLQDDTIREDEYFIHVEDLYDIKESFDGLLIKVTFGSFNKPVTKYLLLQEGNLRYFQGEPIKTRLNLKAHFKLMELLG